MIRTWQWRLKGLGQTAPAALEATASSRTPLLKRLVLGGLWGMLVLSPVQFMTLPLNLAPVDLWNAAFLPLAWLYLIRNRQPIRVPYGLPLWLILLGSFIATFVSNVPFDSLVAILKDIYLFIWFITVAALLSSLDARDFQRMLSVWLAVELANALLTIAQFLSADFFLFTQQMAARYGALDQWRPSGLFENANSTALFQLMGFVPLLLLRPSKRIAIGGGLLLIFSVLATGSLAASGGFLVGSAMGLAALVALSRERARFIRLFVKLCVAILLLSIPLSLVVSLSPDLSAHFQAIFLDRAAGSAEGRFNLWERGLDLLSSNTPLLGIGPDAYRDIDLLQKPLHNDLLAFIVERGLIGEVGLVLLAGMAVARSIGLLRRQQRSDQAGLFLVVFFAALMGALTHAQFHQIFHHRSLWLVLAAQEAVWWHLAAGSDLLKSSTVPPPQSSRQSHPLPARGRLSVWGHKNAN